MYKLDQHLYKGRDINNVNSLMEKLFGCVIGTKIDEWLKRMVRGLNNNQLSKTPKYHRSPYHSLCTKKESCLKDNGLHWYAVNFKKGFHVLPCEHLWRCMDEIGV